MSYIEQQRQKAIEQRDVLFHDPGNGIYRDKEREFVLSDPKLNLWEGIREGAIRYFMQNDIVWWPGSTKPTGHLLSSQVACVNHLFPLMKNPYLAAPVLRQAIPDLTGALRFDCGYVEFEAVGERNYLGERSHQRGANSTSIDALMIGVKEDDTRILIGIEWKYTESYPSKSKYIPARADIYDPLIMASDSPINVEDPACLYYEPFYQLMRQLLLLSEMVKAEEYSCTDFIHLHVIPEGNDALLNKNTSPGLSGADLCTAWRSVLKEPEKYVVISPEKLLAPSAEAYDMPSLYGYLDKRYWS
jgi:hypothetical protein